MTTNTSTITIHTDGACKGNPGPGSWAVIIEDEHQRLFLADRVPETTNQRMELTAAIKALETLKQHAGRPIRLVTDSQLLVKGMTEWLEGWKVRGWRGSTGKPVLNQALWQQLDVLSQGHTISWEWVRGHNGHQGNEEADVLANRALVEGPVCKRVFLDAGAA
ncbi:ribonuclease HI [Marinobacter orientalis]|uniref:Ribonuclease H n=1 Tax=Marinobacter orientalis TaxID=1928859 RepID=A0A7Y0RC69_9GAMM|nr:ribonuclease HI [Marinobacter orientalis]NMT63546.1 ribonuclease HI [Marinobacter orientalis]TGX48602.1 ribonuclease HI [Marinobacter orientalis]